MPIYQVFREGESQTPFSEKALTRGDGAGCWGGMVDTAPVHPLEPQVKSTVRPARTAKGVQRRRCTRRKGLGPRQLVNVTPVAGPLTVAEARRTGPELRCS
jgi:hypothetical protein